MIHIKKYKQFITESILIDMSKQNLSDLLEGLTVFEKDLLKSINAEDVNVEELLKDVKSNNLEEMSNNPHFIENLSKSSLKKSEVQFTKDYECFINKEIIFLPIFDINANELMNPLFLFIQTYNDTLEKLDNIKLYKVNDNIKKFYDKLSSKTIEIVDIDNNNYIYTTSNSGTNWDLQNTQEETDIFKSTLSSQDLHDISGIEKIKIKII